MQSVPFRWNSLINDLLELSHSQLDEASHNLRANITINSVYYHPAPTYPILNSSLLATSESAILCASRPTSYYSITAPSQWYGCYGYGEYHP